LLIAFGAESFASSHSNDVNK